MPSRLSLYPSDEDAGITGPCWIKAHLDAAHQLELGAFARAPGIEAVVDPRRSVEHHDRGLCAKLVPQRSQRLRLDLNPAQPQRCPADQPPIARAGRAQYLRQPGWARRDT